MFFWNEYSGERTREAALESTKTVQVEKLGKEARKKRPGFLENLKIRDDAPGGISRLTPDIRRDAYKEVHHPP